MNTENELNRKWDIREALFEMRDALIHGVLPNATEEELDVESGILRDVIKMWNMLTKMVIEINKNDWVNSEETK